MLKAEEIAEQIIEEATQSAFNYVTENYGGLPIEVQALIVKAYSRGYFTGMASGETQKRPRSYDA